MKYLFLLNLSFFISLSHAGYKEDFKNLNEQLKSRKVINCQGFDLHDVDLSGLNLKGADFSRANLKGANLSKTNLRNARFVSTRLSKANFCNADLTEGDFTNAILNGAQFRRAKLFKINYSHIKSAKGTLFEDEPSLVYKLNIEQKAFYPEYNPLKSRGKFSQQHVSTNKLTDKLYDSSRDLSQGLLDTEYLVSKYTMDLHGKIPLPTKYQRVNSFIKKACRQRLGTVEIITGRGLNNPNGKMSYNKKLCLKA